MYAGSEAHFLGCLPRYPLATTTFVVPYKDPATTSDLTLANQRGAEAASTLTPYEFLQYKVSNDSDTKTAFSIDSRAIVPFIKAHQVGQVPLCPASVHIEVVLEALESVSGPSSLPELRVLQDIRFDKPLVYKEADTRELYVTLQNSTPALSRGGEYSFQSLSPSDGAVYCAGATIIVAQARLDESIARKTAYVHRQIQNTVAQEGQSERFSSNTIYKVIFPRVVTYTAPLETMEHLVISHSGLEGHGSFRLPSPSPSLSPSSLPPSAAGIHHQRFVCHPALIDTILHAAGFMANARVDMDTACICSKVDHIALPLHSSRLHSQRLQIYCSLVDLGHSIVADSYVVDNLGQVVAWAEGMSFKRLSLKSFRLHLSRALISNRNTQPMESNGARTASNSELRSPLHSWRATTAASPAVQAQPDTLVADLLSLIRDLCGLQNGSVVSPMSSLSELGIDSLLLIELGDVVSQRFPRHLNNAHLDLETCQTVKDVETAIRDAKGHTSSPPNAATLTHWQIGPQQVQMPGLTPGSVSPLSAAGKSVPTTPLGQELEHLFRDVFGLNISAMDRQCSLGSLGVDSLGSIELVRQLQQKFDMPSLGDQDSIPGLTLHELEDTLQRKLSSGVVLCPSSSAAAASASVVSSPDIDRLDQADSPVGGKAPISTFPMVLGSHLPDSFPLYLFHDGSGKCSWYSRLTVHNHNMLGIFSLDFTSINPEIQTMEDLAALYIEKAGLHDDKGPVILGGK